MSATKNARWLVPIVFSIVAFVSAALLFSVQPMAAKWLLPALGGSPAVWIAAMLFFQIALLTGYSYTYFLTEKLSRRAQLATHGALLLLSVFFLPLQLSLARAGHLPPVAWLFVTLAGGIGLPLLALAATAPLLQHWFADASGRTDPYVLYAASNLGSFAAVLAYPFFIEPWLPVFAPGDRLLPPSLGSPSQNLLWSMLFMGFAVACIASGALSLRGGAGVGAKAREKPEIGWRERGLWVALAAVPSSAFLGTTLAITTDVGAIPLLWVIPLAAYLLTFVVAFARPGLVPPRTAAVALGVLALTVLLERQAKVLGTISTIVLLIACMTAAAYLCHDRLSRSRPAPERLAEFYLWIAFGGAVGGAFNAVVAPLVFRDVWEYPIAIVLALLLGTPGAQAAREVERKRRMLDLALPVALAGVLIIGKVVTTGWLSGFRDLLVFTITIASLLFVFRPLRFSLALTLLFVIAVLEGQSETTLLKERTFFGVLRVLRIEGKPFRMHGTEGPLMRVDSNDLYNGTTRHGRQMLGPRIRNLPTAYYHPSGPIGSVFRVLGRAGRLHEVGIIGLGVGTLAAYGERGQTFSFYEIDPAVVEIARNAKLFTYLRDTPATVRIVLGDGRLMLAGEPDARFDLIVVDGFTSHAIPVHLLTREAVAMYRSKLRPDGVLALHLSSSHYDLRRVAQSLSSDLGWHALEWLDETISTAQEIEGKSGSYWVAMTDDQTTLEAIRSAGRWHDLNAPGSAPPVLWTDTFSSPLSVLER
jgi:hypothetical protein